MAKNEMNSSIKERTIIVLLLVVLPVLPPLLDFWGNPGSYWFSPYLIWGAMIVAAWLLQRHQQQGPDN